MELYERLELIITAFDQEDVITTSGLAINPEDSIIVDHTPEIDFGSWW